MMSTKYINTYREMFFQCIKFLVKLLITTVVTNSYKINNKINELLVSIKIKFDWIVKCMRDIRMLLIFTFNNQINMVSGF